MNVIYSGWKVKTRKVVAMATDRPNIILFVIDSVRYYSTGGMDDRDKLKMMDEFEKESIYFSTAISSAPSSVMSCASMLTGLPAYYIARNYEDYKYDNELFYSLPSILNNLGYEIRSGFVAREMRDKYSSIIPHLSSNNYPKGIKENYFFDGLGYVWPNSILNEILLNYLKSRIHDAPLFLINWYNVRMDPNTSDEVLKGIQTLKDYDLWNNSIFLMLSDHGYLDPKKGYTPEKLKAQGLTHDLVMTDDNIRIPFYLRYPGSLPQKINEQVCTYDILPTILELLDVQLPENMPYKIFGSSLLPLISDNSLGLKQQFSDRKIRSDGRFFAQDHRCTSIRSLNFKYIIRPDDSLEEFYDLTIDPDEENNIINEEKNKKEIRKFNDYYEKTENEIIEFQAQFMLNKLAGGLLNQEALKKDKLLFIGFGSTYFVSIIARVVQNMIPENKTEFIFLYDMNPLPSKISKYFLYNYKKNEILSKSNRCVMSLPKYGLIIALNGVGEQYSKYRNDVLKILSYGKIISIDPNMDILKGKTDIKSFGYLFRTVIKKSRYYVSNPKYFLEHFKIGLKRLYS